MAQPKQRSSQHSKNRESFNRNNVGRPFHNTDILILNDKFEIEPNGNVGEICIGGIGLADGYLNKPDLTKKVFIPHPLDPERKIYRTGI
ncbi:MAG: AMP-binding protein [Bacteroidia bacterium]